MKITIDETLVKKRIDKVVADALPLYSRAALAKLFLSGHILLNGESSRAGIKLRKNDIVEVDLSPLEALPEEISLPILYEDEDVVVIDKPAGVISHARGRFVNEPSVASFVRKYIADMTGERAGIVHRLDRATSGIMICAKNQPALSWLQQQFADRKVAKTYQAVIRGEMPSDSGKIDMPLARNPKKPQTFQVDPAGKQAVTLYKTLATNGQHSLLALEPQTGRTHQLRVHLAQLRHPIVGDELYKGESASRLMLHAAELKITLPSNQEITFTSQTPEEFEPYVQPV
jgi:23S rRNA pseudouridine1911/1915/1917 synthase